jgi:hypothetical protein
MGFSSLASKRLLDFVLGGASAPAPSQRWAGLIGADGSELSSTITGYQRHSVVYAGAASPLCSASLVAAMTFGAFTNNPTLTIAGIGVWDAANGGNLWISGSRSQDVPTNYGMVVTKLDVMLS